MPHPDPGLGAPDVAVTRARGRVPAAVTAALVIALAAVMVAGFDAALAARVRAGTDRAQQLSVVLTYVGVDGKYVLARACGLTALILAALSTALGLELGRRRAQGRRAPTPVARTHRQLSLVVIGLIAAHLAVPFASAVPPYGGWLTALVPLHQPYFWGTRAIWADSAGIVAFYLALVLGPSYYLFRGRPRLWRTAHQLTVAVYVLGVVHAFFLGTDFYGAGAAQVALIVSQIPLTVLLTLRLATLAGTRRSAVPWVAAGVAAALSVALFSLGVMGVLGAPLGGSRL